MIAFLFSPLGRYVVLAVIVASLAGGLYYKIRHDAQVEVIRKIEQEKSDAIAKGNAARERIRSLCALDPTHCVPDDWFRD